MIIVAITVRAARKARARLDESRDEQVRLLKTGDSFRLHCRTSGRPSPKITWFKDGDRMTEHAEVVVQQSRLVVPISKEFPLSANNFASVACSYIIFSSLSVAVLYVGADFGFALPEFRGIKFCDNDELLSSLKTSLFRMQIFTGWRNNYARFVTTDLNIENVK